MYYALRELDFGGGRRVAVGQPVPEALTWDYPVIVAHLNLEWIKWVETKVQARPGRTTKKKLRQDKK